MRLLLPALLFVALAATASAQDASPYVMRYMDQLEAVGAYTERTPPDSGSSPEAAVRYVRDLARHVAATVAAERPAAPPALREIDAYLVSQFGYRLGGRPYGTPLATWCALWAEEMAPRFAADVARFVAEPTADHAALVWIPAADNVVATFLPYRCDVSDDAWAVFEGSVDDVLATAPGFLETAAAADSVEAGRLRRALGAVRGAAPFVRAEALRRAGDLGAAQAAWERAAAGGAAPWLSVWAAGRLARSLSEAGQSDAALAVLDRAAPLAPSGEVPADTVRAWYAAASAAEAERRYVAATAGPALVPTDERVAWADGLVDLETGAPFDPASLGDRLVLLDVWATWCGACLAEFPALSALAAERGGEVAVVAVSVDAATGGADLEGVRDVAARLGADVVTLVDPRETGGLPALLGIGGYPARFAFGPGGAAYASRSGARTVLLGEVEAFLDARAE